MVSESALLPLHISSSILPFLLIAGAASFILVVISFIAFIRRRSFSYLLIFLALVTFLSRSLAAALAISGSIPDLTHHYLEHALDIVMAALIITAIYYAREIEKGVKERGEPSGEN